MDIHDFVQMAIEEMADAISGEYAGEQMRRFYGEEFDHDNDGHMHHYCMAKDDAANRICIVPPLWAVQLTMWHYIKKKEQEMNNLPF